MNGNVSRKKFKKRKEIDENQKQIREMVMESYRDIAVGKGRDCREFFDKLEKKYTKCEDNKKGLSL